MPLHLVDCWSPVLYATRTKANTRSGKVFRNLRFGASAHSQAVADCCILLKQPFTSKVMLCDWSPEPFLQKPAALFISSFVVDWKKASLAKAFSQLHDVDGARAGPDGSLRSTCLASAISGRNCHRICYYRHVDYDIQPR